MVYTLSYSVVRTNVCMQQAKRDAESDMLSHFLDELDVPASTSATPTPSATTGTDAEAKVEEQPQQVAGDDDLMADFFSSISSVKTTALDMAKEISTSTNSSTGIEGMDRKNGNLVNEKYVNQELGTATEQADRLTQPNYLWRNLNPYYVLQLYGTELALFPMLLLEVGQTYFLCVGIFLKIAPISDSFLSPANNQWCHEG
jgi:hypothetical protein